MTSNRVTRIDVQFRMYVIPDNLLLGVEEIKDMFWDKISPLYDIFENIYNGKVYTGTGKKVAELIDSSDEVLEEMNLIESLMKFNAQPGDKKK